MRNFLLDKRFIFVFLLGFSSGLPLLLTLSTLVNWLSRLGLESSKIGLFAAIGIPYSLKFLWSFIFDYYKIPKLSIVLGQRVSWLIITQILLIISIIMLGFSDPVHHLKYCAICALLVAFFSASQDIVIDAIRIEILEEHEQAVGVVMNTYGYRIAMLISGAGALYLSELVEWKIVYIIMSCLIFIGMIAALCLVSISKNKQAKCKVRKNFVSSVIEPLKDFLTRENAILLLILVVMFKLCDAFIGIMINKFYVDMGFSNKEIAKVVKSFGTIMTFAGSFIAGYMGHKISVSRLLLLAAILQGLSNLVFIPLIYNQHDLYYLYIAITIDNLCGSIGNVAIVAYLSMLCNKKYTATQYALLSSLSAVGRTFLSVPSGYVVQYFGWKVFFIISSFLALPSVVLMFVLQRRESSKSQKHLNLKV